MLRIEPYTIRLKRAFTLASGSRTATPAVLVELEREGITGFGEASLPPSTGETQEGTVEFLRRVDLSPYPDPGRMDEILKGVDALGEGHHAAKAAVDIALHDWVGKRCGRAWCDIRGLDRERTPLSSYTISIGDPADVEAQVRESGDFPILKVKCGGGRDRETIQAVRRHTDVPLRVDANGGWKDPAGALETIRWMKSEGVELVEQPLPPADREGARWLKERSPLPLIADEAVRRLGDLEGAGACFHGVNIKLMKCTGMAEARRMILRARELGLGVMLGCMTETSCGISAASQLAPLADWLDLDGALLIEEDPFRGATLEKGILTIPREPGIGAQRRGQT
ncbi:MAG: dipeptide epimerase [Bacteroidota bacterium]